MWASLLSKMSCLCGFNKDDDQGDTTISIKVKQNRRTSGVKRSCCSTIHYNKTINVSIPDGYLLENVIRKLDDTMEDISVSSASVSSASFSV